MCKKTLFFFFCLADDMKLREERGFVELFICKFLILFHMDSSVTLSPEFVMAGSSRHTPQVGFLYFIVWADHFNKILDIKRIIYV